MSLANKTTDSQSRGKRHTRGWPGHHRMAVTGVMLALTNLFAGAAEARGPRGENPWGDPVTPDGARRVFTYTGTVPAPPDQVFPLLCPVLEYEWIDGWSCSMKYSESGVAEQGCAFSTRIQIGENWICSKYNPPTAIQYVVWLKVGWMVLDLSLTDLGDGTTELHWQRTFTATKPLGRKMIGKMSEEQITREMKEVHDQLVAHLEGH